MGHPLARGNNSNLFRTTQNHNSRLSLGWQVSAGLRP
jgi:hypothetical protein